ncbi:MAG TPA: ATP-binding cassette domain-containing protein [Marmoricola sp.]|nr:ATP-binding cassette domain-containing protein [Marmoricola sp.]
MRDLRFSYDDSDAVLDGINLTIEPGELVLVAGRTGSGKSTLLGTFNGLVPAFTGGTLSGDVLLDGVSIIGVPPRERAQTVGYVGQDPLASFVTDTVEEELAYGMEQLGLDPATIRRRVEETLDLLGIADLRSRDLRTLSGGQQQRVAIGAVLTMHPRLLVLDEPTSALDPTAAEDVLATLARLVHDLDVSVVLAEHRLERVLPFADRVVIVEGGGSIREGSAEEMMEVAPVAPPIIELGRLLDWQPLPLTVRDARRRARSLAIVPQPVEPHSGATSAPKLIAAKVSVRYGARTAVSSVNLTLNEGSITALMGRNGSGKSSLLWALQGSGTRSAGSVIVDGVDSAKAKPTVRRCLVGLVPQTAADLLYLETVADECRASDALAGVSEGDTRALLERLVPGIQDNQHPRDLSEGQRLALVLALVLAAKPGVVALDEPTRGLDYPGKVALAEILRNLADEGRAVIVASHDVEFVAETADRVVVLADGEIVAEGDTREVVSQTPAFAPQVQKILGDDWLTVAQVVQAINA